LIITPKDEKELADAVASARGPFAVDGLGSKRGLGRPTTQEQTLSLAAFSGVNYYEPAELVIEAGAATPLDEIESLLDKNNQQLAFDPPDYSRLFGTARGSIGGVLACNLSGSRRLTAGAARDHILGVRGVSGRGEIFKAGGRVVKNVTGYDISKLMAGSFGTLAALTSVTFKVLPKPETETTLVCKVEDVHEAGEVMRAAMQSPHDVSCAAYNPGRGVMLRVEGIVASVKNRTQSLIKQLNRSPEHVDEGHSRDMWRGIRDATAFSGGCIWRISVAPGEGPRLAEILSRELSASYVLDWSGGLIWLGADGTDIRGMMDNGHAMLWRAPDDVRCRIDAFHPQPPALSALSARVKQAFDPRGLFNPGRMYEDV
jgi:glycolate oxidase FAD binding subunit